MKYSNATMQLFQRHEALIEQGFDMKAEGYTMQDVEMQRLDAQIDILWEVIQEQNQELEDCRDMLYEELHDELYKSGAY
jgi:hypothetical protein